jgi:phosphotransferase system HPr (HPr) family protein
MAGYDERTVTLGRDLHARPAGQVAQAAARCQATIELSAGDRSANARSVLAVMALGAVAGTPVRLVASGVDAATAADDITAILTTAE